MAQYVSLDNLKTYDENIKKVIVNAGLSYKGTATARPADMTKVNNGDMWNFDIPEVPESGVGVGDGVPAVKGFEFWDKATNAWVPLSDATLAERVEALETQVGKDKTVNKVTVDSTDYEDLVDIVNLLTSDVTTEGSILESIYSEAANGLFEEKEVLIADTNGVNPGEAGYIETKETKKVSIKEAIENIGEVAAEEATITIKTDVTDAGYLKTYSIYQGGEDAADLVGKINIPKDFLVKSGEIVTFSETDTLPTGVAAAGKYLALTINVAEDTDLDSDGDADTADQIVYINVKDLVDVYTVKAAADVATDGDEVQLAISSTNELSATLVDGTIAREKIDADFEADLAAIEAAIGDHKVGEDPTDGSDIMELYAVADRISAEAKDAIYKAAVPEHGVVGDPDYVAPQAAVTIAEAIKALEDSAADTNGALVFKGDVSTLPTTNNAVGDTYTVDGVASTYADGKFSEIGVTTDFTGTGFTVGGDAVDMKAYIDSRIWVGKQSDYDDAIAAKEIDSTTFAIITDEAADTFEPIDESDITDLFNGWI